MAAPTWRQARLLDVWEEETPVQDWRRAQAAAKRQLDQRDDDRTARQSTLREEQWLELQDRLMPTWPRPRSEVDYVGEGVLLVAERTLLALYLQSLLTGAQFQAMTAAWTARVAHIGQLNT